MPKATSAGDGTPTSLKDLYRTAKVIVSRPDTVDTIIDVTDWTDLPTFTQSPYEQTRTYPVTLGKACKSEVRLQRHGVTRYYFMCSRPANHTGDHEAHFYTTGLACCPPWPQIATACGKVPVKYKYLAKGDLSPYIFGTESICRQANLGGYECTRTMSHTGPHAAFVSATRTLWCPLWDNV